MTDIPEKLRENAASELMQERFEAIIAFHTAHMSQADDIKEGLMVLAMKLTVSLGPNELMQVILQDAVAGAFEDRVIQIVHGSPMAHWLM